MLSSGSTYDATIRIQVAQAPADVRDQIRAAKVAQAVGGDPTSVVGPAIVITNGPPLSRKVVLLLGLLLWLGIGAGAGLLVETAFRNDHLLVLPAGMASKHPGELLASRRLLETVQTRARWEASSS